MMEMFDAGLRTDDELMDERGAADGRPFYRKISSLKDLAGIAAAVTLYSPSFKKLTKWEELHTFKYGRENDIICNLALPLSIRNMLGRYVNHVIDEIIEWYSYHDSYSITYQTCAVLFDNHHCEIVWECDGDIDYEKTALKMLSHPDLEEQEKFIIASLHCLENDMKKMLPLQSIKKIKHLIENPTSLLYYWYHILRTRQGMSLSNHLKFWPMVFFITFNSNDLHQSHCFHNPCAVIHFWKRLPFFEQLRVASPLIESHKSPLFQKDLLLKMNANEQLSILQVTGVGNIIVNFTLKQHHLEYAVSIWEYIRNTVNQQEYLCMLTDILLRAKKLENNIPSHNLIYVMEVIWETTPLGLKRYASDIRDGAVINLLTSFGDRYHLVAQFAMLVSILPNIELSYRKSILHKISSTRIYSTIPKTSWEILLMDTERPLLIDKFVKLGIPNSKEQTEFKKIMDAYEIYGSLWHGTF